MVLDELADYAAENGLANVAIVTGGSLPSDSSVVLGLFEYPGRASEGGFGAAGVKWEYPRVQVQARGEPGDYETARRLAEKAYQAFARIQNERLSNVLYRIVTPLTAPFLLKRDTNDCPIIAFNLEVWKDPSPAEIDGDPEGWPT